MKMFFRFFVSLGFALTLSACGNSGESSKLQAEDAGVINYAFVGIPSHDPPRTIANGGSTQFIQQHHTNEVHIEVGVESVIGKAILHKPQQKGKYLIETGYINMQGWWGTAHE